MTNYLDILSFLLKERKFRLVKFEVSSGGGLMGCHDPFDLDSGRMMKIYEMIDQCNAVVALDIGDRTMASYQPENLSRVAKAFPNMKMVLCHLLAPARGMSSASGPTWNCLIRTMCGSTFPPCQKSMPRIHIRILM